MHARRTDSCTDEAKTKERKIPDKDGGEGEGKKTERQNKKQQRREKKKKKKKNVLQEVIETWVTVSARKPNWGT